MLDYRVFKILLHPCYKNNAQNIRKAKESQMEYFRIYNKILKLNKENKMKLKKYERNCFFFKTCSTSPVIREVKESIWKVKEITGPPIFFNFFGQKTTDFWYKTTWNKELIFQCSCNLLGLYD